MGVKLVYLKRICKLIESTKDNPEIEVTDWSQMILLLNIFTINNFNGTIKGLKFNINNHAVISEDNNSENDMVYLTNISWFDIF